MTTIESEHYTVNANDATIFSFLTDLNNIEQLLPKDKISDWESDQNSCSFKIQKAATIPLILDEKTENSAIKYVSGEKTPFPFTLEVFINQKEGESVEVYMVFNGEINAFL